LWTPEDDLLFLRYCPSKRDKCYHAISRDLSARPHEILKLKIKDMDIKSIGASDMVSHTKWNKPKELKDGALALSKKGSIRFTSYYDSSEGKENAD
jgi:hypothetical protein